MMRMTLGVRNLSAVIANLQALNKSLQTEIRAAVKQGGEGMHATAYTLCPVDTGFMRDHLALEFTPKGYGFEIGWKQDDFLGAGLDFYPPFVVFGTVSQAPQDPLTPAYNDGSERLIASVREAMRRAVK